MTMKPVFATLLAAALLLGSALARAEEPTAEEDQPPLRVGRP